MNNSEMNQILKSKFGCSIGNKVKLSPSLASESPHWGVGIVRGYISPCYEEAQDYVSIDFENIENSSHPENAWLVAGEFVLVQN